MDRPRTSYKLTFAVLAAAATAFGLLQSLVAPALPAIQHDLHASQSTGAWVLTSYLLSASVATPVLGRLADAHGKERMLLVVLGALLGGSVVAALAPSIGVLVLGRVLQGLGGAIFPIAFGIIRDEFPPTRAPGAIGMISALLGAGGGLGIVLAGPIVTGLSWPWLFWLPTFALVPIIVAAVLFVPSSPVRTPGRPNPVAGVLLAGWLLALLLGVSEGPSWGWTGPRVLGLLAAAAVLLPAWVLVETRSANPLVDMAVMRLPVVARTNMAALLFGFGMYATFVVIPPLVQAPRSTGYGFGGSVTQAGLAMLPTALGMLVAGLFAGRGTARFGARALLLGGSLGGAAGMGLLVVAHRAFAELLVADTLLGLGIGFAYGAMGNLVVGAVPATQVGAASGMNTNLRTVGGSLGSTLSTTVITAGVVAGGLPRESGYVHAFALLAGAFVLAAVAAAAIPRPPAPAPVEVSAELLGARVHT